ncbi:MAG: TIM-barrel domain-containing protein [Gemmatimonadota bacterium]
MSTKRPTPAGTDRMVRHLALLLVVGAWPFGATAQEIRYGGAPAELTVSRAADLTIEVQLSPIQADGTALEPPESLVLIDYPREVLWTGRELDGPVDMDLGEISLEIRAAPLRVVLRRADGSVAQSLSWPDDTEPAMHFETGAPVYGLGQGGPQFDRRGVRHEMRDGWGTYERPTHGSRVAAPMLIGADGWSLFVHHPMHRENAFDLEAEDRGAFIPSDSVRHETLRVLVTAWDDPVEALSEYRAVAGRTPMPPLWSLGYMQSHRTIDDPTQMVRVAHTFRDRALPIDAVIYLGTGFTPSGWNVNMGAGGFEWNDLIWDEPERIISSLHDLDLRVVMHNYNPPIGLYGTTVDQAGVDPDDELHMANYWARHLPIVEAGVDAWWPDGGEGNSPEARLARHRMYDLGARLTQGTRSFTFHRTGYSGIHRHGGLIWSGDPDSYWETLRTQIPVALNHVVSLSPFWGVDVGGFLPSRELTGELYARWFQFSTFTVNLRAHGRGWHLRLPWGWNTAELGPAEVDQFSDAFEDGYPFPEELRNGLVEPIVREYLHLRYRMLPYNYTLFAETRESGVPPMRPMWLHYPDDPAAAGLDDQFLWGRDMLVVPVYEQGATSRTFYLPGGEWHDFWTNERVEGGREVTRQVDLGTIPLYVRAGTILPLDPVRQHTGQVVDQPTNIHVYPGDDGSYRWYRDDGESFDYEDGAYSWTRMTWDDDRRTLVVEPDPESGGQSPPAGTLRFTLVGSGAMYASQIRTIEWDGTRTEVVFAGESH